MGKTIKKGNVSTKRNYDLPPHVLFEDKTEASLFGNVLHLNNNTIKQTISNKPINYFDEETNSYKKISTEMQNNTGKDSESRENIFKVAFASSLKNGKSLLITTHAAD